MTTDLLAVKRHRLPHGAATCDAPIGPRRGLRPAARRGGARRVRRRRAPAQRAPPRRGAGGVPADGARGPAAGRPCRAGRGRQGGATTVRDFRRHAGLDLLPRLLGRGGELDVSVVRSILEARLYIGPHVAGLAAQRAGARLATPLREAVAALEADHDPVARQRHALTFWDHVVDGADSIAFRLMFNGLRATYEPLLAALATVMQAEVGRPQAYRALADAIAAADPKAARAAAEDLLSPATDAILTAARRPEPQP